MEITYPGSIVEIDVQKIGKKKRFNRIFVALKPCANASSLNGKNIGQLTSTNGVDGRHNWLYYIVYTIFDIENEDNWKWFMWHLRRAVGSPLGLLIYKDACKGLEKAVGALFPEALQVIFSQHISTQLHGASLKGCSSGTCRIFLTFL